MMENEKEKKGLLGRLMGSKKTKKGSCCCNYEIEELPEENTDKNEGKAAKEEKENPCCK